MQAGSGSWHRVSRRLRRQLIACTVGPSACPDSNGRSRRPPKDTNPVRHAGKMRDRNVKRPWRLQRCFREWICRWVPFQRECPWVSMDTQRREINRCQLIAQDNPSHDATNPRASSICRRPIWPPADKPCRPLRQRPREGNRDRLRIRCTAMVESTSNAYRNSPSSGHSTCVDCPGRSIKISEFDRRRETDIESDRRNPDPFPVAIDQTMTPMCLKSPRSSRSGQ